MDVSSIWPVVVGLVAGAAMLIALTFIGRLAFEHLTRGKIPANRRHQ